MFRGSLTEYYSKEASREIAVALAKAAVALTETGERQAARKRIADALKTAEKIDYSEWRRVSVLSEIATAQAKVGKMQAARKTLADALKTAQKIDYSASGQASALNEIAAAQAKVGERQAARKTFADAVKAAQRIDEAYSRAWELRNIVIAQAEAGEQQAARMTLADVLETVQGNDNIKARYRRAIVTVAQVAEALKFAQGINNQRQREYLLLEIAVAQAEAGNVATALEIAQGINNPFRRVWALEDIAAKMANTGEWLTARKTTKAARKTIIDLLKPALEFDDAGMRASALSMIAFSIRTRWPMGSPPTSAASALSGIAVALAMVRDPQTDKALRLDRSIESWSSVVSRRWARTWGLLTEFSDNGPGRRCVRGK